MFALLLAISLSSSTPLRIGVLTLDGDVLTQDGEILTL